MANTKKKSWKYTERHNKILGAICEIMASESLVDETKSGSLSNYTKEQKKTFKMTVFPTSKEISEKVGFSKAIVERHLEEINLDNFKGTAKALTPAVLSALGRSAISTGRAPEVKLWFQIVEDWEEKSQVKNEQTGGLTLKMTRKIRKSN